MKIEKALAAFDGVGAKTVALPAMGTGKLNYAPSDVADVMIKSCKQYLDSNPLTSIQKVYLVIYWHDDTVHQVGSFAVLGR